MINRFYRTATVVSTVILLSACGMANKQKFEDFTFSYRQADYCKAADIVLDEDKVCELSVEKVKKLSLNTDERLNGGTALFLANKYEPSAALFEKASTDINDDIASSGIVRGAIEVVTNASVVDYNPMVMDSIYLHTYAFMNALAQKNKDEAKLQINRSHSVQQNAVKYFSSEIEKQKEQAQEDTAEMSKEALKANKDNISHVMSNYKEFARWKGYSDFVNPYMTYLSGLYFMTNGTSQSDYETASNYMKRVRGMVKDNSFVKKDLKLAENLANGKKKNVHSTAWVIFENGMVANFKEFRIDLPVFIATNEVKTASLALPYPNEREQAYPNIKVSNGKKTVKTEILTNVDSMFISEFYKKLPTIVSKAVTKLALQTTAQVIAQKKLGDLGGIAAAAYSAITAGADTRSWYGLPKDVQLAKIKKSGDKLNFFIGDQVAEVAVAKEGNSLIYVRVPSKGIAPTIDVFDL